MELKHLCHYHNDENKDSLKRTFYGIETLFPRSRKKVLAGLNRTFYGIETSLSLPQRRKQRQVLIVPFMELKPISMKIRTSYKFIVLIVPFMELKRTRAASSLKKPAVLIVPFMELKPSVRFPFPRPLPCLNRTFYGIETLSLDNSNTHTTSLNRTFYGIETGKVMVISFWAVCLNRTFYGIETIYVNR